MTLKENEIILTYYEDNPLQATEDTERHVIDIINQEQLTTFIDILCKTIWIGDNFSTKHIDQVMNHMAISLNDKELDVYEKWQLSKQIDKNINNILK